MTHSFPPRRPSDLIAKQQGALEEHAASHKAKDGDTLTIDFVGKIDGEAFEGGSAEEVKLKIGSGQFITGFEEQLTGVKKGDEKTITVTFPGDYSAAHVAGQEATFDITVKAKIGRAHTELESIMRT